ncbi:MAG: DEAD/DEAH box helicase [Spartobacteria bacterium]|nr:DEAD/DEAH box helicase [Spartobacteria bacterium]
MQITDYHAKYFACELTRKCPSNSVEKIASTLMDSHVDLNPHQIDAALFAFRSPLSKGALLADEVGLGKTIEAGIVLAQKWAERKRRILLILPSSLRKQWHQELLDKFYLPSSILEAKSFNRAIKQGEINPFDSDEIVICSYYFARNKKDYVCQVPWDLVVIDEAHRLRNVYKKGNKIANELKAALYQAPKLLLTATPLQNSLMELYGLVSFIDEHVFGDVKSYKAQFARLTSADSFDDLKSRLNLVCKRTLRRQVTEYISYTERRALTQDFVPTEDEEVLYDMVSEYLRRPNLMALPASQRSLMTLIMRKLLASSTFAIAGTLNSLANKLEYRLKEDAQRNERADPFTESVGNDFETYDEYIDENEVLADIEEPASLSKEERDAIQQEIIDLRGFYELALQITQNAKGEALLQALESGFSMTRELGGAEKAIIFTESRRTQNYLLKLLMENGYKDKIVLFNGTNTDPIAKQIYNEWKSRNEGTDKVTGSRTADTRAALVDHFRNDAQIMIATEAAAEGINLQFCSLVVNYDLPWNPQRIEQRIGRCHRYGQKHDVVVVNFLNRKNAADKRVFELLSDKFQLFKGVFGASDEVLGAIGSGVDFEKRIVEIYQSCRTPEQIQFAFDQLQAELGTEIDETIKDTRKKLLEHFDSEVAEKLKVFEAKSTATLDRYEALLWRLTKHELDGTAEFDDENLQFKHNYDLYSLKTSQSTNENAHLYRLHHPLAQQLITQAKERSLETVCIEFDYSSSGRNISILEPLIGERGILVAQLFSVTALETEDYILFGAQIDDGTILDDEQCRRLFDLPGIVGEKSAKSFEFALNLLKTRQKELLNDISERNAVFFDEEMEKLDKWAQDVKTSLEIKLKQIDLDIKIKKADARKALQLEKKVLLQRQAKRLEGIRNEMRMNLFQAQDEVDEKKEELLETVEARLQQTVETKRIMEVNWRVK